MKESYRNRRKEGVEEVMGDLLSGALLLCIGIRGGFHEWKLWNWEIIFLSFFLLQSLFNLFRSFSLCYSLCVTDTGLDEHVAAFKMTHSPFAFERKYYETAPHCAHNGEMRWEYCRVSIHMSYSFTSDVGLGCIVVSFIRSFKGYYTPFYKIMLIFHLNCSAVNINDSIWWFRFQNVDHTIMIEHKIKKKRVHLTTNLDLSWPSKSKSIDLFNDQ